MGKSSVIRDVARYLARDFMLYDQALPIVFPLQDVRFETAQIDQIFTVPPGQRAQQLFEALVSGLVRLGRQHYPSTSRSSGGNLRTACSLPNRFDLRFRG